MAAGLAAVPLVAIVSALFSGGSETLDHLFGTVMPTYAVNSAILMVLTALISGTVGTGTAWLIAASEFPGRRLLSWLLVLPIAAPAYIVAYLYTDLLEFAGPVQSALRDLTGWTAGGYWFPEIRSLPGASLMLSFVLYPYVYLLARASFSAQSRGQLLAARTLGISPFGTFMTVALPAARPAIFGGLALVMMETLADFGVAEYFAIPTFSTGIFRTWFALGDRQGAMQLAGVMLIFVLLLVTWEAATRRGRVASGDRLSDGPRPFTLKGGKAALACVACAVPVLLGFVGPVLMLLANMASQLDDQPFAALAGSFGASLSTALIVAVISTALAVLLVYAVRGSSGLGKAPGPVRWLVRFSTLGYALPGALLAIGILAPLSSIDVSLTRFLRDQAGWSGGLVLTGTAAMLIYALTVRFLTISYNSASAGMGRIPHSLDAAARSLGAGPARLLREVQLPLLSPQLLAGSALVFVDVMRELPATLILRPFNFETLATRVYRLASDERIVEASTPALLIVLVGLVPVMLLTGERRS
ncbi:iron ABC transporter permease [Parvularcula sp. ZS-1/3]|uniref:Iron ABC transporter permease n=1 Tax=Parvularcula mediterranea TaxID=2732508 RepID=A0A7Y3RPJ8_9PROT|nr:iron ABC transporter permease [Parvularcula mediterranea]